MHDLSHSVKKTIKDKNFNGCYMIVKTIDKITGVTTIVTFGVVTASTIVKCSFTFCESNN